MILKGNIRANGAELAIHLMKDENEHIEIVDLRGFAGDTLLDAFLKVQALSAATRCQKYLYSLSLNPPKGENATSDQFDDAIERSEETLGLGNQPRAIVRHTKEGRTHYHAVWSRIDSEAMKAIKLHYPKRKLNNLALEIFYQHGWEIPAGFLPGQEADPMNYTYLEYQEAKRGARDPKHLKHHIKTSWSNSDNRRSFEAALERGGLFLARGDRRGYVAEVKAMVAERMTPKLQEYVADVTQAAQEDLQDFETQRTEMTEYHRAEREALQETQQSRWEAESAERANRFSSGLKGAWHRLTGKHAQIV